MFDKKDDGVGMVLFKNLVLPIAFMFLLAFVGVPLVLVGVAYALRLFGVEVR